MTTTQLGVPKGFLIDLDGTILQEDAMSTSAIIRATRAVGFHPHNANACAQLVLAEARKRWKPHRKLFETDGSDQDPIRQLAAGLWELLLCPLEQRDFVALHPDLRAVAEALYASLPAWREEVWAATLRAISRPESLAPEIARRASEERWAPGTAIWVPGARDALQVLEYNEIVSCIVTNGGPWQHAKIRHAGLPEFVGDRIVVSSDVGSRKPDSGIIVVALEKIRCTAHETMLIDDALHSGVLAAANAGLRHAFWLNSAYAQGTSKPVDPALLGSYSEVKSWSQMCEQLELPRQHRL